MNDYERKMNKASVQKELSMFRRDKDYFYAVILISIYCLISVFYLPRKCFCYVN